METAFRVAFVRALTGIMGDVRLLWMPSANDALSFAPQGDGGPAGTYSATAQGRLSTLGKGLALSFNGTDQYLTVADSDRLSFGNGTTDQAFSLVALVNVTNTAAARVLIAKYSFATAHEWFLTVEGSDLMTLYLLDQSVSAGDPFRRSDAAVTQGSWGLLGATYDGAGGATAANGITLYQNGAVVASTATNNASYVAMENKSLDVSIGVRNLTGTPFGHFNGSMALVAVCAKALTAADHAAIASLCRTYFGVAL